MATATHNLISASRSVRAGKLAVCGVFHHEPMTGTCRRSWQSLNSGNCSSKRLTGSLLGDFTGSYRGDRRDENVLKADPAKVTGTMIMGKNDFVMVIKDAA